MAKSRSIVYKVLHPYAYHGPVNRGPFFEGWYYKIVTKDGSKRFSIIPGVYVGRDESDSHSFIQILDGISGKSLYLNYPFEDFQASNEEVSVTVKNNQFTTQELILDIKHPKMALNGSIKLKNTKPWPVHVLSPGIMGIFAWVPGMECYHGVVSLDHELTGSLSINGEQHSFNGGRGYIEKDWGKAMPKAWIWMQSNHFSQPGTSLSASIATIPWTGFSFNGFIVGFLHQGILHRFATYNGSKIEKAVVNEKETHIILSNRKERIEILAKRSKGSVLQAPTTQQMDRRIMETLSASIHVQLFVKDRGKWVKEFEDTGKWGGLEIVGTLPI